MLNLFAKIGHAILFILQQIGSIIVTTAKIISYFPVAIKNRKLVLEQMALIGADSLPLVLLIGSFTGAIAALQATTLFDKFGLMDIAKPFLGGSIATVVLRELTPVLTALVIAGRVGGSMAAQIGTMVVTEQVDALEMMAIDKHRFLGMPRVFAALVMMPILAIFSCVIAMLGAYVMVIVKFDIPTTLYFDSIFNFFKLNEIWICLGKSALFGFVTSVVGVWVGFSTEGGAEGVGNSTVRAFTISAALILVLDALCGAL
ncbi:MAG: ABC transporter permease [Ignavibacteria bacterium]|jgi:phospholipid/cholesterol/gamma-HCH transport system permease protein|nr:ABC transporter permease [Ignavibacteria bacterium]